MNSNIDFEDSLRIELPSIDEEEAKTLGQNGKGWSFSYVYHFSEIRDVYLALRTKGFKDNKAFTEFCLSINLPFVLTEWNERRILEHLNALKNFSLIDTNYKIIRQVFSNSKIGDSISKDDLSVFHEIYFSYFRFKELFSWFINLNPNSRLSLIKSINKSDIQNDSRFLFAFSERGKLKDTFFYDLKDNAPLYYIRYKDVNFEGKVEHGNEDLMRFWDVFIKWGSELNVIEHFNLNDLDIKTSSDRDIVCCYVINNDLVELDLLDYIDRNYIGNYIHLPELVFRIGTEYRLSIKKVHEIIINQYGVYREYFSLERTSEIFIRRRKIQERDKILFPKYNDAYVSHMLVIR